MDLAQNGTDKKAPTSENEENELSYNQELWVRFCATGGLITDDDGNLKQWFISGFADEIGVPRRTLYNWKKQIPKFNERVAIARKEIFQDARFTKMLNGLYLRAAKGDAEQAKLLFGMFNDWQPPAQKHEVEVGESWATLLAEKRKRVENITEGEVIDAPTS